MATSTPRYPILSGLIPGTLALFLAASATAAEAPAPTLVRTEAYAQAVLHPQRSVPGAVLSLNDSQLSAETAGRIDTIPVLVGQTVDAGAVLVRLDCRDHRFALKRAAAALAAARARSSLADKQFARARRLHRDKNVSEELVNQREAERAAARADVDAAAAARDQAALEVERCNLKAPFDGVVTARLGQVGQRAAPGTPLIQLLDRAHLEVSSQIPVDNAAGLGNAGEVWLETGGARYPLKLRSIAPVIDPQARSREARFTFVAKAALPGAAGRVVWQSPVPHVPADLVVRRGKSLGVFVAEDGRARFVALPGAREGQPAVAELPADARLITDGRYNLSDGAAIRLAP